MWLFPQQLLHLLVSLIIVLQSPFSCRGFDPFISRLAVDYGPRLIGVAASFGRNIQPLITIPHCGNLTILSGEIINLARSKGAVEIIVGVPLDRDGRMKYTVRNLNGILSLNFSSVLAAQCIRAYPRAQVLIMDERYTTREAREKSKEEYPRASIDAVSAACLLERYLEDEGCFNTLPALPSPFPLHKDLEMLTTIQYGGIFVSQNMRIVMTQFPLARGFKCARYFKYDG